MRVSALTLLLGGALGLTHDGEPPHVWWLANNLVSNADSVGLASGLQYQVIKAGPVDGAHPEPSTPCECHYRYAHRAE